MFDAKEDPYLMFVRSSFQHKKFFRRKQHTIKGFQVTSTQLIRALNSNEHAACEVNSKEWYVLCGKKLLSWRAFDLFKQSTSKIVQRVIGIARHGISVVERVLPGLSQLHLTVLKALV